MFTHDWGDARCRTILQNCRRAAYPGARAYVIDSLVDAGNDTGPVALLDMDMLASAHGQEREPAEFDTCSPPPAGAE
ncbi:methyltransferase [Streptomyces sp. NPDC020096]